MSVPDIYNEVLVCYDVQKDKKRTMLSNALKNIGLLNIQKSVFWGYATLAERKSIQRVFREILDPKEDRAFILPCKCRNRILGREGFGYGSRDLPEFSDYGTL